MTSASPSQRIASNARRPTRTPESRTTAVSPAVPAASAASTITVTCPGGGSSEVKHSTNAVARRHAWSPLEPSGRSESRSEASVNTLSTIDPEYASNSPQSFHRVSLRLGCMARYRSSAARYSSSAETRVRLAASRRTPETSVHSRRQSRREFETQPRPGRRRPDPRPGRRTSQVDPEADAWSAPASSPFPARRRADPKPIRTTTGRRPRWQPDGRLTPPTLPSVGPAARQSASSATSCCSKVSVEDLSNSMLRTYVRRPTRTTPLSRQAKIFLVSTRGRRTRRRWPPETRSSRVVLSRCRVGRRRKIRAGSCRLSASPDRRGSGP